MAATAPAGTHREAILVYLAGHVDLTAYELARAIGVAASTVAVLLWYMEADAQVVSRLGQRPGQGREVRLWRVAPPGTSPPPRTSPAAEFVERRRNRDRIITAAQRARARIPPVGAVALPGAACLGADPDLFFPEKDDHKTVAAAKAICAGCPVRAACYARAVRNGERHGIWGGVHLENPPEQLRAVAGGSGECQREGGHHDHD
jgi:Transcription factor WhiB